MARIALLSFRLGLTDGVSIEAAKWQRALERQGHDVITIAGEGPVDVLLPGLAIGATHAPTVAELTSALEGIDVVVVENLISLPLNVAARDVVYEVLVGRPAILHHHDLAWQRDHLAHLEGPRDDAQWRHVTINELSRAQLAQRHIVATTIMNSFNCDPVLGDRDGTRAQIGIIDERLVVMPTRAIPRKNVSGAIDLATALDATLWLLGPAEDGFDLELETLLNDSGVALRRGLAPDRSIADAYAASDLVVMSSTWEGFGNPVLESVTHRRALALNPYPVAQEITAYGFSFFTLDEHAAIRAFLDEPDTDLYERNLIVARKHFNESTLPSRLADVLATMGVDSPAE